MSDHDYVDDLDTPTAADVDECYGSKFLSAGDLGDRKIRTKIMKVRKESLKQQDGTTKKKIALFFTTLDKPLILNATNKNVLVDSLNGEPAAWIGAEIGLYAELTTFAGKPVKGLRLRVLNKPAKATAPAPNPATHGPDVVDDGWEPSGDFIEDILNNHPNA
ncbi:MAG: hypothetical protein ACLP19_17105 [Xanthobacteraceae bacterium]